MTEEMLGLEMGWVLEEKKGDDDELQDMLFQGQNKLYSFTVGWKLGFVTIWQSKSALLALVKSYSWTYFFPLKLTYWALLALHMDAESILKAVFFGFASCCYISW